MVGAAPPASVKIMLSTVSLDSSFDAYLYVRFVGPAPDTLVSCMRFLTQVVESAYRSLSRAKIRISVNVEASFLFDSPQR
jgi:hypothetical protein